ncbi:dephospho-CoA kinase [Dellaglioa algida]|uniref:Dephospho-CoA kinase n=1 Tax=Dellaglioa algida TaxID=105612 RepID=A0A5C6MCH9_9LACO|nr:dephospho-CoA kinase [Dellaglioa algida]MDK1716690.1 dephospho-CoA kinase [Dellaglioa algida]MDK1720137.1 dephospho-CoA kinase [Dellaglioa algida]MDK1721632.1 dephospho-CoA kinase [Dellaglioa algida]MDK1723526.1 dephospho-CoA kinase [Dellaglioa algida]MDK1725160.1 dephospho-CoA kinase [Dellaglioa algida]
MTYILGLTGGIATGKSTVSHIFKNSNVPVIDADIIARQVVEPKSETLKMIINEFGEKYLMENGALNRKKLGKLVFNDGVALEKLNGVIHPAIRKEILAQIQSYRKSGSPLIVLDMPLLFEESYQTICDAVMVVFVPEITQLKRLINRDGLTSAEARLRIKAQWPIQNKKDLADFVIDNSTTVAVTRGQVLNWLSNQNNV